MCALEEEELCLSIDSWGEKYSLVFGLGGRFEVNRVWRRWSHLATTTISLFLPHLIFLSFTFHLISTILVLFLSFYMHPPSADPSDHRVLGSSDLIILISGDFIISFPRF